MMEVHSLCAVGDQEKNLDGKMVASYEMQREHSRST